MKIGKIEAKNGVLDSACFLCWHNWELWECANVAYTLSILIETEEEHSFCEEYHTVDFYAV